MVKTYKKATIRIIAESTASSSRWKPSCHVTFIKNGRKTVKRLNLNLEYDSPEQAERAGMVFSKNGSMPVNQLPSGANVLPNYHPNSGKRSGTTASGFHQNS
jgi:hypothetical protein